MLENKNIAQVAAGRYHSMALTSKAYPYSAQSLVLDFLFSGAGILYSWGCGENGQLGLESDENVCIPTVVRPAITLLSCDISNIRVMQVTSIAGSVIGQVACGEHHTVVLTCTFACINPFACCMLFP